jgi:uncharacterized protein (UPF0332 family)
MKEFAAVEWQRALRTLETAKQAVRIDPDSAASRAYYAAFHALTALFALRGQSFSKHSALRAAVHRDLVKGGEWSAELGEAYQVLSDLCEKADYGGVMRVSQKEAKASVDKAAEIIEAVRRTCPELEQGPCNSVDQEK